MSSPGDGRSPSDESPRAGRAEDRPQTVRGWLHWFWTVDRGSAMVVREFFVSVGAVLLVGLLLFSLAGVWPPMVAIESGSMEPHMQTNDLVFITDNDRFVEDAAYGDTGVVPHETGRETGYTMFGDYGDVIVFEPNGNDRQVPIIHRAHFWVEEGENWYDRANPDYVGDAESCADLRNCPAPNAGFITKGDNEVTNQRYDQARGLSGPVQEEWVIGTAEIRIPWLGWVRLQLAELAAGGAPQVIVETTPQPIAIEAMAPSGPADRFDRLEPALA